MPRHHDRKQHTSLRSVVFWKWGKDGKKIQDRNVRSVREEGDLTPVIISQRIISASSNRISSRIDCSVELRMPSERRCAIPAKPCLKAFWFLGGPDLPHIPAKARE
jgi:hypothetical protein